MSKTSEFLESRGLVADSDHPAPTSRKRFPDGAQYRVEIPSVEGPAVLEAVLEEASEQQVLLHRVSQGSGGMLLTDAELNRYAEIGSREQVEVSLFARPTAAWDIGAAHLSTTGAGLAAQARGTEQLSHALQDIERTAAAGVRSVLVTDLGVMSLVRDMRNAAVLPPTLQMKVSVQMGLANPASIAVAVEYGADTYNVPTDLTLAQLAAIRQAVDLPIDIYVEAPDDLGGFIRHYEIGEIVRVAAPVYLKFGLRNSPFIYPSGSHLDDVAGKLARERVRRARIGLDILQRQYPDAVTSDRGAAGIALPESDGGRK